MRLRHILEVMNYDRWIWFNDDTCEWLGLVPNSYKQIGKLMNNDCYKGLIECKVTAVESMGIGGIRVGLERIIRYEI